MPMTTGDHRLECPYLKILFYDEGQDVSRGFLAYDLCHSSAVPLVAQGFKLLLSPPCRMALQIEQDLQAINSNEDVRKHEIHALLSHKNSVFANHIIDGGCTHHVKDKRVTRKHSKALDQSTHQGS